MNHTFQNLRPAMGTIPRLFLLGALAASCGGEPPSGRRGPEVPRDAKGATPRGGMDMGGMMAMMGNMPEGIEAEELPSPESRGARLVARYCAQCHGIPTPRRLAAEEWDPTLRRMLVRMERMSRMPMHGVIAPSPEDAGPILEYLQDNALRSAQPGSLPADDPWTQLFLRTCSRCHAPPDPTQHKAEEWPGVVERMRENMRRMDVEGITEEQARRIVEFLKRHARGGERSPESG